MPELPEVETIRRGLAALSLEAKVESVWRSDFELRTGAAWRRADEDLGRLRGATPMGFDRRGKFLLWHFDGSRRGRSEPSTLLIHLGMSGRVAVHPAGTRRVAHTHLSLSFADGRRFDFVDPRRFGGLRCGSRDELPARPPLAGLGPEPFSADFNLAHLEETAARSRRALRELLLDQRVVAGVGNIYASEICWHARLHPLVAGRRLRPSAWARVIDATRFVLEGAISRGGTTLRDYRDATGREGQNQLALAVYGRGGENCVNCAEPLLAYVHQARSGVLCPRCQARPRGRWAP